MDKSIEIVKFSVYLILYPRYEQQYEQECDKLLAVAVSNELFSRPPGNSIAEAFSKSNRDVIEGKLSEIKNYENICKMVSQAVVIQTILEYKPIESENSAEILSSYELASEPIEKLNRYGIFIPEEVSIRPEEFQEMAKQFIKKAEEFYKFANENLSSD